MKTSITGLVIMEGSEEYPCRDFRNLVVKVFGVTLSSEKSLLTLTLDEIGMFAGETDAVKNTTLMARLYMKNAENDTGQTLVAESGPHCPKNGIVYIEFKYDPSKFGKPLYTLVNSSVTLQLGRSKLTDLNKKQIEQLLCIACVGKRTLDRLISANKLFDELKVNMRNCIQKMERAIKQGGAESAYLKKALANIQLLSNEAVTESILFALLENDNSLVLDQILTISSDQLKQKIQRAVDDNIIAPVTNEAKIIDGFIALRNCILFNSNYDNYFYDAKLIYLSSMNLKSKSNLLDRTIESGSLLGVMGEEDRLNNSLN